MLTWHVRIAEILIAKTSMICLWFPLSPPPAPRRLWAPEFPPSEIANRRKLSRLCPLKLPKLRRSLRRVTPPCVALKHPPPRLDLQRKSTLMPSAPREAMTTTTKTSTSSSSAPLSAPWLSSSRWLTCHSLTRSRVWRRTQQAWQSNHHSSCSARKHSPASSKASKPRTLEGNSLNFLSCSCLPTGTTETMNICRTHWSHLTRCADQCTNTRSRRRTISSPSPPTPSSSSGSSSRRPVKNSPPPDLRRTTTRGTLRECLKKLTRSEPRQTRNSWALRRLNTHKSRVTSQLFQPLCPHPFE